MFNVVVTLSVKIRRYKRESSSFFSLIRFNFIIKQQGYLRWGCVMRLVNRRDENLDKTEKRKCSPPLHIQNHLCRGSHVSRSNTVPHCRFPQAPPPPPLPLFPKVRDSDTTGEKIVLLFPYSGMDPAMHFPYAASR